MGIKPTTRPRYNWMLLCERANKRALATNPIITKVIAISGRSSLPVFTKFTINKARKEPRVAV